MLEGDEVVYSLVPSVHTCYLGSSQRDYLALLEENLLSCVSFFFLSLPYLMLPYLFFLLSGLIFLLLCLFYVAKTWLPEFECMPLSVDRGSEKMSAIFLLYHFPLPPIPLFISSSDNSFERLLPVRHVQLAVLQTHQSLPAPN